ncbi:uncharacterized protein LACBIDRAFT_330010 [Laccaria bicolor S238N-H82]|uniref:Predicted protein n=1 Tax=Laccaria bicolor (strain S238N-H82 / ATCC MYA-4686) TaxID=486041 RepID=B0DJW8_LACBS|nr:uncharacterized protein LACBIDRAFT_330010 [Laccaria bicolor S238N-H82]EDR05279.1 predicted protein [Laccaria bicolor S238N-H82]|eukprot:XP_001884244.1 predicted protein [Laccaria bicolor S238N-H82]
MVWVFYQQQYYTGVRSDTSLALWMSVAQSLLLLRMSSRRLRYDAILDVEYTAVVVQRIEKSLEDNPMSKGVAERGKCTNTPYFSFVDLVDLPPSPCYYIRKLGGSLPVTGNSQTFNSQLKMLCIQIFAWRNIYYVTESAQPWRTKQLCLCFHQQEPSINSFSLKEFVWSFEYSLNTILTSSLFFFRPSARAPSLPASVQDPHSATPLPMSPAWNPSSHTPCCGNDDNYVSDSMSIYTDAILAGPPLYWLKDGCFATMRLSLRLINTCPNFHDGKY